MSSNAVVLTVGTFDVPHCGHAIFLQRAAKLGKLIVGVNTDEYVLSYKKRSPVFDYESRSYLLSMLDGVSEVIPNSQDDLRPMLEQVKPDFLVIGSDWGDRYFEQIQLSRKELKDLGVTMLYLPYTLEISTSKLIKEIKAYDGIQA